MNPATRHSLAEAWQEVQAFAPVHTIHTEEQHRQAARALDTLLELVGHDETHSLYELVDVIGTLVHAYEEEHLRVPEARGTDVLRFLMEEQSLTQSELPEVGTQGVISELLAGKRELNVRQIRTLSKRFGVSPAVFF